MSMSIEYLFFVLGFIAWVLVVYKYNYKMKYCACCKRKLPELRVISECGKSFCSTVCSLKNENSGR